VKRREQAARLGREGEQLVRQALERRGVEILAANWHSPYGELDLIAATPTHVRFIEVKTRTSDRYMEAREAVDAAKQHKILLTAQCWLMEHPEEHRQPAFDVAEVYIRGEEHTIRYYASAFEAEEDAL
jgi:putative endonuclease